jgi:hypothetical protein
VFWLFEDKTVRENGRASFDLGISAPGLEGLISILAFYGFEIRLCGLVLPVRCRSETSDRFFCSSPFAAFAQSVQMVQAFAACPKVACHPPPTSKGGFWVPEDPGAVIEGPSRDRALDVYRNECEVVVALRANEHKIVVMQRVLRRRPKAEPSSEGLPRPYRSHQLIINDEMNTLGVDADGIGNTGYD